MKPKLNGTHHPVADDKQSLNLIPKTSGTPMNAHELLPLFTPSENDTFVTSHSEKGIYEDYYSGKEIPKRFVIKYDLYRFTISPILNLRYKVHHPAVILKAIHELSYQDYKILIYAVGIQLEAADVPESEGVDLRALVISSDGNILEQIFLGGHLREGDHDEVTVARAMTFDGDEIVMTLLEEDSFNVPSHLRVLPEERHKLV